MSFASQKNDMLLRNMIFRLNVEMIGSTSSNMICLASPNVVVCFGQDKDSKGVPIAFPNFNGWGDLSMRSFHSLAQNDTVSTHDTVVPKPTGASVFKYFDY